MKLLVRLIKKAFAAIGFEIHRSGVNNFSNLTSLKKQIYESSKGVLHIGGHRGQEASTYARAKANVLWVEALGSAFMELQRTIQNLPGQEAVWALLGDEEKTVSFHVASNEGMSSSIHRFAEGNGYDLFMTETVNLEMKRLDNLLTKEQAARYPHWVVDVQGGELSVLRGAGHLLDHCQTIDVEVSTFEVYEGGISFAELDLFLREAGFIPLWQPRARTHEDLLYVRARPNSSEIADDDL